MEIQVSETLPNDTTSKLEEFFISQLHVAYHAEQYLYKSLPGIESAVTSDALKRELNNHWEQTKQHIKRLEQIFRMMNEDTQMRACDAICSLIDEGRDIIDNTDEGTAQRDAGLIFAMQKIEHYEIATYGGLAQLARTLNLDDIETLLRETLNEEKAIDTTLTQIAESNINYKASKEMGF